MTDKIFQRLNKPKAWISISRLRIPIIGCIFNFLGALKAFCKYNNASEKKVVSNICLRTIFCDGVFYSLNLFSTKLVLNEETIKYFVDYAESISEFQMKSESERVFGVIGLAKMNKFMSYSQQLVLSAQKQFQGAYIVVMSSKSKNDLDIPYVICFDSNNEIYRVAICRNSLNRLGL